MASETTAPPPGSTSDDQRRILLVCVLLVAAGLVLRFFLIGSKSLWADETYTAGLMGSSISDLVTGSGSGSPHPPLAFMAFRLSAALFGTSEAGLRAVTAILSALAAAPLFLFTKRKLGFRPALFAGGLWVVSPFAVSLGQEVYLYGPLVFVGFLFVLIADMTWEGNRRALFTLVPLGLIGMLVHHLFAMFVVSGFALYFTRPRDDRIPLGRLALLAAFMIAVYIPFVFNAYRQIMIRAERLALANLPATAHLRLVRRVPTVFARLIANGLAGHLSPSLLRNPVSAGIFVTSLGATCAAYLSLLTDSRVEKGLRIWAAATIIVPLLMFINEDPTVRHLSVLWIPLALGAASLARRIRWSGAALMTLGILLLIPYYRTEAYPYHRSDYREATEIVRANRQPGEILVILGSKHGGLAWDYYSGDPDRLALGGENPYSEEREPRRMRDHLAVLDSIIGAGNRVWVVHDIWGRGSVSELLPGRNVLFHEKPAEHMEVLLFGE